MSIKNPMIPAGIEPVTFRFVAQHPTQQLVYRKYSENVGLLEAFVPIHLQTRTSTVFLCGTMKYKAHVNNSHSSQELTKKSNIQENLPVFQDNGSALCRERFSEISRPVQKLRVGISRLNVK